MMALWTVLILSVAGTVCHLTNFGMVASVMSFEVGTLRPQLSHAMKH